MHKRKIIEYIFLSFLCFWITAIEVLTVLIVEPKYLNFIVNQGVFFLPLLASLGIIFLLLYIFVFKFPTIQDIKNKANDVEKNNNIKTEYYNQISDILKKAQNEQNKIEHQEKIEILENKIEIKQLKNEAKIEELKVKTEIASTINNAIIEQKQIEKKDDFKEKMSSW